MPHIFRALRLPDAFNINKGNVRLVNEDSDYSVKYPDVMGEHIAIDQANSTINITLDRDFPDAGPILINLNGLSECSVSLDNGIINSEYVCPIMRVKVNNGNLSAKVSKANVGEVKAKVDVGLLKNNSNLEAVNVADEQQDNNVFGGFGNFMNMGFANHIELMGSIDGYTASFHVGAGLIDLVA